MTIVLPALGVAFAAFSVWLTVRIVNRRERWAKWTASGILVLLALYPLSCGPAAWMRVHVLPPSTWKAMDAFYFPFAMANRSLGSSSLSLQYVLLWVDGDDLVETVVPAKPSRRRNAGRP